MCENMNSHHVKPVPLICRRHRIPVDHISVLKAWDGQATLVILIYFRPYDHDTCVNLAIKYVI